MGSDVGYSGIESGDSTFERGPTNAQESELRRYRGLARRSAVVGVGLFGLAWLLGGIGETLGLFAIVPFADMSLGLGFVLALVGAIAAGAALQEIVPVGILSGVGHFYKGQDHTTHVSSGWGLGLEHTPHILLGLVLIGVATATAGFLAFYRTRGKTGGRGA